MWKNFLCRIKWHNWTKWDEPRNLPDGRALQFRKCVNCNIQQRNVF